MRAVSNTSPISGLAYIGRLSLLRSQFTEIWIPPAVLRELKAHPDTSASTAIESAIHNNWIQLGTPSRSHLLLTLSYRLDLAEAEAIALATQINADVVLLDEREGRRIATQAGLRVTGILGLLLRAKLNGEIPALKPEIQLLRTKANFFIAKQLESEILSFAGE